MRKQFIVANWKMNNTLPESYHLITDLVERLKPKARYYNRKYLKIVIAPPFTSMYESYKKVKDLPNIFIAAQNCSSEESGAYTGEVSAAMIRSTGAEFVILGHSERRKYFSEDAKILAKKVDAALNNGLSPIFCVGEMLSERETSTHFDVIEKQLMSSLFHLEVKKFTPIVIAYEPVWAIGTGLTATPQQAQEMHSHIRKVIAARYGKEVAEKISVLYGGSCNPKNAFELFGMPDVDGGLIGGASLIALDFIDMVEALSKAV
ncbi:MAG: triose-phosphate isomerase [Bacteroidota bacterium]